jgi:hypothetical protein
VLGALWRIFRLSSFEPPASCGAYSDAVGRMQPAMGDCTLVTTANDLLNFNRWPSLLSRFYAEFNETMLCPRCQDNGQGISLAEHIHVMCEEYGDSGVVCAVAPKQGRPSIRRSRLRSANVLRRPGR